MAGQGNLFPNVPHKDFAELSTLPPGVYANLDDAEYHAFEAPSKTRLRNGIVGPTYAWANCPWNPMYQEQDTAARLVGRAYHKRILEGPEAFAEAFAQPPHKNDYPDALKTADEIKAELGALGLKKSGNLPDLVARLRMEGDYKGEIWHEIIAKWEAENAGRAQLPPSAKDAIDLAAMICEQHPDIGPIWEDGFPEVSIFWVNRLGLPMRARIDWLKPGKIIDLKTIANQYKNPIEVAVAKAVLGEYYHLQAVIYREAVEAALSMPNDCWHGFDDDFIERMRTAGAPDFQFLFIGKSAPDICQRILAPEVPIDYALRADGTPVEGGPIREPSMIWKAGEVIYGETCRRFAKFWRAYGRAPWFDEAAAIGLRDSAPGVSTYAIENSVMGDE